MRSLPKPALRISDVFDGCIAINPNGAVSQRCLAARSAVLNGSRSYLERAGIPEFTRFRILRGSINGATPDDMAALYTRLRDNDETRDMYNALRAIGAPGKCPYCGSGQVGTLDHYLPKMKYPLFAVTPLNLVPCCERCNNGKKESPPRALDEQFFHPYFDDFTDGVWLSAQLIETIPVSAVYSVLSPGNWPPTKQRRVRFHFEELDLATVYISNAAQELEGVSVEHRDVFETGGEQELRTHLHRRAGSHASVNPNSWQTALYRACEASDWYCTGGFFNP